jgi:uncharacterized protein (TIGR02145 family)
MKKDNIRHVVILQIVLVLLLILLGTIKLNAQLKVGNNPKTLNPNVLLEIESYSGKAAVITKDSAFLGLGTLVPTRRLEIQNGNNPGAIKIVDGTQGFGKVLTSDSNGVAIWSIFNSSNIYTTDGILSGNRSLFMGANTLAFDTNTLFINPTNNTVGIGTSAPTAGRKLDVRGLTEITVNSGDNLVLQKSTGASLNFSDLAVVNATIAAGGIASGGSYNDLLFSTNTSSNTGIVERMRITKNGNVGIGTATPNSSALLELYSANKGFLPPRMTNDQMKAIASPVNGLMVYNTTLNCMAYYVDGSYNCTHNKPAQPAQPAPLGSTYTAHFNGITAGVSVNHLLATYSTGETFAQNTDCAAKEISAQGCGGLTQVTGASGTVYPLVNINGQCWMQTNLKEVPSNFSSYTPSSWLATSPGDQGYWGYYNTATTNGTAGWGTSEPAANEGYLYQWNAAMDNSINERSRGVCPAGFHIPSDCEWKYLEHGQGMAISEQNILNAWRSNTADNQGTPGYKLRSQGTGQTNASGFSGLLAGYRSTDGTFISRASYDIWGSSSATGATAVILRYLNTGLRGVVRSNNFKALGFSVRCLKD